MVPEERDLVCVRCGGLEILEQSRHPDGRLAQYRCLNCGRYRDVLPVSDQQALPPWSQKKRPRLPGDPVAGK